MKRIIAHQTICISITLAMVLITGTVYAQSSVRHNQMRSDMPPGVAADRARMSNPSFDFHMQPVQIIVPQASRIEVGVDEGYVHVNKSRVSLGMHIGPVYRIKVTNIARFAGKELYPSVEILNKLSPPEGLETEFPIQVVISQDDLEQALEGNMVTKVIYLEDPKNAVPHKHLENEQPFFDVGGGQDPMRAAERLGRPMAILRIGSRIPTSEDRADFNFRAPEPHFLPAPERTAINPKWEEPIDFQPLKIPNRQPTPNQLPSRLPRTQPSMPSIVPNQAVPGQATTNSAWRHQTDRSILRR